MHTSAGRATLIAAIVLGVMQSAAPLARGHDAGARAALLAAADTFPRFDRVLLLEPTAETSANVSIGDVNGDGHVDIVLAKGRHWPLVDRVLLGDGAGSFATPYDLGSASDRS